MAKKKCFCYSYLLTGVILISERVKKRIDVLIETVAAATIEIRGIEIRVRFQSRADFKSN